MSLASIRKNDGSYVMDRLQVNYIRDKDNNEIPTNTITQTITQTVNQNVNLDEVYSRLDAVEAQTQKLVSMMNIFNSVFVLQDESGNIVNIENGEITTTPNEVEATYDLTPSQISWINSNVLNSIGQTRVLDLGVVLTKCYRIEMTAKANVANDTYINIIFKNDENGSTLLNTGFQKTYSTKSRNYGEMDLRYIRIQSYWNPGTLQSVRFFFKELQN